MDLLISAGQVLVGPAGERIADGAVLVRGREIAAVGPRHEVAPPGVPTVSFPDATVLPGLIDCHVHLAFDAQPEPAATLLGTDDPDLLLAMAGRARQLLDVGITTVRDLGDRRGLSVRLREAIAADLVPGPRIVAATAPLTSPGGHCWFLGGEVSGDHEIRNQIRANAQAGAEVIKVMATGGHLTPGGPPMWQSQFTADELRVIVYEAKLVGLPVAAHVHGTAAVADAVAAGVDTLEHCTWMAEGRFELDAEIAAEIVNKGIYVCPAIGRTWLGYADRFGPEVAEQLLGRLRWMEAQGVRLIAGTDAGIPGSTFDGYVDGLRAFVEVGFSAERTLELATIDAAAALGLDGLTGQVAAGLRADLLVVGGDPRAGLNALRDVRLVMADGRAHVPRTAGPAGLVLLFRADPEKRAQGIEETGTIVLEDVDVSLSSSARRAADASPGLGTDAVVWEEIEHKTGEETHAP